MTRDDEFSIISVNADDGEEIVIQAGVLQGSSDEGLVEEGSEDYAKQTSDDDSEEPHRYDGPSLDGGDGDPAAEPEKIGTYRETTREDLKTVGPMNRMRLIILFGGLFVIVGFTVYYLFLR